MNPAASGAADSRQADRDNSSKKPHRASSPGRFRGDTPSRSASKSPTTSRRVATKQSGKNSRGSSPVTAPAGGKDKQTGSGKGAAAVHPTGAESPTLKRAEASKKIEQRSNSAEDSNFPEGSSSKGETSRVVSDQPCSSKSSQAKGKNPKAEAASSSKPTAKNTVGCGPGFWRDGCLQSELIQFHINKSLKNNGGKMHTKTTGSPVAEPEQLPVAVEAVPVPQPNQEMQDEIERLEDENDDLKVGYVFFFIQ